MRRAGLIIVVLCAVLGAGQVRGASAHTTYTWVPFHLHMNAYAHWGHCGSEKYGTEYTWQESGSCDGMMEAGHLGSFNYGIYHSQKVVWTWTQADGNGIRKFTLWCWPGEIGIFEGHMPYNWHTLAITHSVIWGKKYVTGNWAPKGEEGGPLYVDLSSHSYAHGFSTRNGYSLDIRGYLREIQ